MFNTDLDKCLLGDLSGLSLTCGFECNLRNPQHAVCTNKAVHQRSVRPVPFNVRRSEANHLSAFLCSSCLCTKKNKKNSGLPPSYFFPVHIANSINSGVVKALVWVGFLISVGNKVCKISLHCTNIKDQEPWQK